MGADASKGGSDATEEDPADGPTPEETDAYEKVFRGELDAKAAFRAAFESSGPGLDADALDDIVAQLEGQVGDKAKVFKDIQMLEEMARQQEAKEHKVRSEQTRKAQSVADSWVQRQVREGAAAEAEAIAAKQAQLEAVARAEAKRNELLAESIARARLFQKMEAALIQGRFEGRCPDIDSSPVLGAFCAGAGARGAVLMLPDVESSRPASPPRRGEGLPIPEFYEVLAISLDATFDEIKKAYRKQALLWHPDKNRQRLDESTARFQKINEAFDTLYDPQQRSAYDAGNVRGPGKAKKLTGSGWAEIPDEDDIALTPVGLKFKKKSWQSYVITYGRIDDDRDQIVQDDRDPRAPQEKIKIFWRYIGEMAWKERDECDSDDWLRQFILKVWKDTPTRWPKALELQQMNEASREEWRDRRTVFNRRKQKVLLHLEMHESYLRIPDVMEREQDRLKQIFAGQSISGKPPRDW